MNYDIIIVGGSLGGVRAAISAAKYGKKVLMTEETDWIGGQLTSQAVPPDEHKWIESQGATDSYMLFRKKVRDFYKSKDNFTDNYDDGRPFCPGASWVSRVAHEPTVAHKILSDELAEYEKAGLVTVLYNTVAISAEKENDVIKNVRLKNLLTGECADYTAAYFLDGTDCGDLLPITDTAFRMGAESQNETGEKHAPLTPNEHDMQPVTWVFAMKLKDKLSPEDIIEKPKDYDYFSSKITQPGNVKLFSWYAFNDAKQQTLTYAMFDNTPGAVSLGMWSYRRVVAKWNYKTPVDEVSLINWPQNDYCDGNIYGNPDSDYHLKMSKELSRCFAYYLQNEAINGDKKGYPVAMCGEVLGTTDGFAKAPYIRESRRIVGKQTVVEQDVSKESCRGLTKYPHSVGVGHYHIDLHRTTVTNTSCYAPTYPFEIPMGAMVPDKTVNLIPACKNISCTHLTNGCYRLHPVEWNVGEVAGLLAAFCLNKGCTPAEAEAKHYAEFEKILIENGIQLHWNEQEMDKSDIS